MERIWTAFKQREVASCTKDSNEIITYLSGPRDNCGIFLSVRKICTFAELDKIDNGPSQNNQMSQILTNLAK